MTNSKPITISLDALETKVVTYSPGISPIYEVVITNNNNTRKMLASVSYERMTGRLVIVMGEAGA